MEKKTEGAWIVNHTPKLQEVSVNEFENIETAGKCGILLSNLAADSSSRLEKSKVDVIARISGLNKLETDAAITKLSNEKLIIKDGAYLQVLGVTTSSVLEHTANLFEELTPTNNESAALELSEMISICPLDEKSVGTYLGDTHKISSKELTNLFAKLEETRIVDYEIIDNEKIYFNGNLFKREDIKKTKAVIDTLTESEARVLSDFENQLRNSGCVSLDDATKILGNNLLSKLHSIGMYDFNQVSNHHVSKYFITRPAAFSKYGKSFEEDALDLAKAFIASLAYGMRYSGANRGKIYMLRALLQKLISGNEVGPCTAIGQDYRILELKRVIQLRYDTGNMYFMKLLKKDVGILALQVLETGDASEHSVFKIASENITQYKGPEAIRNSRRKKASPSEATIVEQLRVLRK